MKIDEQIEIAKRNLETHIDGLYGRAMLDHLSVISQARKRIGLDSEIDKAHTDRVWSYAKLVYQSNRNPL